MDKIGKYFKVVLLVFIGLSFLARTCKGEIKDEGLKIIGHRGASGFAPENTLEAFKMASTIGMWGVEADVYTLSDGNLVIFHDEDVERMTDGCGKIQDKNLKDVKKLNINDGTNIDAYSKLEIPTFEEYLECCRENKLVPIIELKKVENKSIKKIVKEIKNNGLEDTAIIISVDYKWINDIRKYSDKIQFQCLSDITVKALETLKPYGNFGIDIKDKNVTKEKVKLAHKYGATVNVWDVKTKERYEELKEMGVDMITSNYTF